jgi:hypothetical protein
MGLDMYLVKVTGKVIPDEVKAEVADYIDQQIGATVIFEDYTMEEELNEFKRMSLEICQIIEEKVLKVKTEEVGYWRKANQIHNWFVNHVQNGVDDCGSYLVTKKQLQELYDTVDAVMLNPERAMELLPTRPGFFFGSYDYDEYYYRDLSQTAEILDSILTHTNFETETIKYQSSW